MKRKLFFLALLLCGASGIAQEIISQGSLWKYNDGGTDLGTSWKNNAYDDASWASGAGVLGYGDGVEETTLSYGSDSENKHITYYFRRSVTVANAQSGTLNFNILKDDGVVVYVNGVEAFRSNMPTGTIAYNTLATNTVGGADETAYMPFESPVMLQNGENVIAVELHQATANSSDLGFDLKLEFVPASLLPTAYPLAKDSQWHFLDTGTSLDAQPWKEPAALNADWSIGTAPLGYGDPANTVVSFGLDANNKFITTYFYKDIVVNISDMTDMAEFGLRRDDGAIVYINGVEVFRDNMPEGTTNSTTFSATTIDGANEKRYWVHQVPKSAFQNGVNRIAVEVHNRDGQSSDLGFDLYVKNTPASEFIVECDEPHIGCFTSIMPTGQTPQMIIPQEHRFQLMLKQGSNYTETTGTVPGNHDYTAYVGTGGSSVLGRVAVNHENNPGGVTIMDIHFDTDQKLWITDATRPVDFYNSDLVTTNRNCSGGTTPWGTVITAEEATDAGDANGDGYHDVGWLVEVDPATSLVKEYGNGKQEKLWAMGRMNHENVVVASDNITAYYGEDGGTHCVYKFVADAAGNLSTGSVYVLKLDLPLSNDEPGSTTATWIQVPNTTVADCNNIRTVAAALGGTNFNGVEDCEISPLDGMIYFTSKGKDRIYRFRDNGMTVSDFETFAGGMSYPIETSNGIVSEAWGDGNDNLTFDNRGNLWMLQDGGNNYIWVIRPDHTQSNPNIKLFASMPAGSEPTGLTFTPDFKFGFFSVQHPSGNNAPQLDAAFNNVVFDASAVVVFSLAENIGVQAPVADFAANATLVEEGTAVTFADLSTGNPSSWLWTFEGGNPTTSTLESPTVTYPTAGSYNVSLVTSNAAGVSTEVVKSGYIVVEETLGVNPEQGVFGVKVYPNPSSGLVTLELNETSGQKITVEVFDVLGRCVTQLSDLETSGLVQKIDLDLTKLSDRQMLIIRLKVGERIGTYKVLKTK
ncbi:MAG TPA: alkaline phosphatase PhoX [Flavobacterium sp.]|jgi:PKD repeat protein